MKARTAIGLMSGTSLDGIDAAILGRDLKGGVIPGTCHAVPYDDELKSAIMNYLKKTILTAAPLMSSVFMVIR